jgi:hypothetical protein
MRPILLATLLTLAPPLARACDTDYLNSQLTLVCRAALAPASDWLRSLVAEATAAEAAEATRATALANQACESGDPEIGALEAVRLARLAGRIEARLATQPAIWPSRQAAR